MVYNMLISTRECKAPLSECFSVSLPVCFCLCQSQCELLCLCLCVFGLTLLEKLKYHLAENRGFCAMFL